MNRWGPGRAVVALLLLSGMACRTSAPKDRAMLRQELTDSLTLLARTADFNGFGVALAGPDGVWYSHGFGTADAAHGIAYTARTVQPIASISKTFVGLAVMKAQELGLMELDDPINAHLPFSVVDPHFPDTPITVRHLVTHTSGILDTDDYLQRAWVLCDTNDLAAHLALDITPCRFNPPTANRSMEDFLRNYLAPDGAWYDAAAFADTRPGARFAYSNIGATLAALVVETASGMPFEAFTQRYLFDPLGMKSTTWHGEALADTAISRLYRSRSAAYPRYACITWPDGGLVTSSADMALYLAELIKGHRGEGSLLGRSAYAEYFKEQLDDRRFVDRATGPFTDEHNIGILMGFSSEDRFGHTGGDPGLFSMLFVDRGTGVGRYMIVNTDLEDHAHHVRIWELLGRYAERLRTARE